ncbi:MAG: tRNA guanosine(34) transglycosylase Tgt [Bdellovibrionales bacterium]|nr:tRNA guanosine(34) transglycosylase Tgt [Bdellovibrionales bacterium]
MNFFLQKTARGSKARAARFTTLHGEVETPVFMPVGTQATVKSQTVETLKETGSSVLLANTYHLLLRPGPEVFRKLGGIHSFMKWDRPVLTDSGGFQIFSLPHSRRMNEEGALFQSYVDGRMILLTPELSIETQKAIGSDIMMVLDQCIPSTASEPEALAAMELTHRWALRSLNARGESPQSMFGIVQGACYPELRKRSADFLTKLPFDGFAIGGLAVGESKQERETFTELAAGMLPEQLPRYLMGVGTPIDILEAVHRGVDMFDCILPSQLAQRGTAFTSLGKFQLRRSVYKFSEERLDPACSCVTCADYSRAYLHHLVKSDEVLGWHLIARHNIHFYHQLMKEIRKNILNDTFHAYYEKKRIELVRTDEENPSTPFIPAKPKRSEKRLKLGDYEVHHNPSGFSSIRQVSSGEIMHSVNPPELEARTLYLEPSQIPERLKVQDEIVIWDVGLGAASNAMAVIDAHKNLEEPKKIRIESFEIDLDPLRLALKNNHLFKHLRSPAPNALVKEGAWRSPEGRLQWRLFQGDFLNQMDKAAPPDLVFFDPFSPKVDGPLWTANCFKRIFRALKDQNSMLMTYSVSTLVRALLLSEGFYVGSGAPSGPKAETTVAFAGRPAPGSGVKLLGAAWLERWERSGAKVPLNLSAREIPEFEETIRRHPQFTGE